MTTRWYPDTCGCAIDLDASGHPATLITRCPRHAVTASPVVTCSSENRSKNQAQAVLDAAGANYTWTFSANGTLQITIVGATAAQKSTWKTAITPKVTVPFTVS